MRLVNIVHGPDWGAVLSIHCKIDKFGLLFTCRESVQINSKYLRKIGPTYQTGTVSIWNL